MTGTSRNREAFNRRARKGTEVVRVSADLAAARESATYNRAWDVAVEYGREQGVIEGYAKGYTHGYRKGAQDAVDIAKSAPISRRLRGGPALEAYVNTELDSNPKRAALPPGER